MNQYGNSPTREAATESAADAVVALMRFLRVLRYRKSYMVSALVVAGLFGSFYYLTATRIYQATASLLVTQTGGEMWGTSMTPEGSRDALIPTYERLFSSAKVLDGALRLLDSMPPATRVDLVDHPREKWRGVLRENLSASAIRRTSIIELTFRSKSPLAAEAVVEAIVQSYLDFMEENHKDVSVEIAAALQEELEEKAGELHHKQQELLRLEEASGALGLPDGGVVVHPIVQRVVRLNETLIEVQKRRLELDASLKAVRAAVHSGGDLRQHLLALEPNVGRELMMSALGLSPQSAEIANQMERQLVADHARLKTLSEHYGPTHPEVVELRLGIEGAERNLAEHQAKVNRRLDGLQDRLGPMLIGMIEEKLAETWTNERQLTQQYEIDEAGALQLNGKMVELELARSEVRRLSNWHDTLLNQIAKLDLRQNHGDVRVSIVSEPMAHGSPISPRLSLVGLLCLLGGFGSGATIVYVLDLLDDRFRSPDEMKDQLGVPVLAMVRKLVSPAETGVNALQVNIAPTSVESEAFRTLRTTLAFSAQEMQRVAVTSSEPGDGKTTVIANLAVSYAQAGKRVLLIDCDLRRPGLSKLFGVRRMQGLTEVLRGSDDIEEMCLERIQSTEVERLEVLPCGPKTPDPTEVLSSTRFVDVIAWAETHYDQVLVDCPPVMAASDAAIVGRVVDGMILVVQPEKNHRRLVLRAAENLTSMAVDLIGIVANRVGDDKAAGYYGFGYGYGYGYGYGSGYGHDEEDPTDDLEVPPSDAPRRAA